MFIKESLTADGELRMHGEDATYKVTNLRPKVKFFSTYTVGGQHFGTVGSSSKKKSNVLVQSSRRLEELKPELEEMLREAGMEQISAASVFPENELILHPARILKFVEVSFDATENSLAEPEKSNLLTRAAHFAIVEFYGPHPCRREWQFGNVFEIWSSRLSRANKSRSNLVCVNHLAGKFYPALFDDNYQSDRLLGKQPVFADSRMTGLNFKVPQAMAVLSAQLRCPL